MQNNGSDLQQKREGMYKIGICDDGENICKELETMILKYAGEHNISMKVYKWYDGEEACRFLAEKNRIDILFLDIELFEMSGMDVGHFIREKMKNHSMQIVYISSKTSYARQLFKTQPMDFLEKPIGQQQMNETLEMAMEIIGTGNDRFEYESGKERYFVPYHEIRYLVSEKRKIKLLLAQGEREFYGKIADIASRMPKQFIMIHQSYIVNKNYVARYRHDSVELGDGTVLPISKAYRKSVRQNILREEEKGW